MAVQKTTGNELLIPESGDDAATFIPAIKSNFEKLNEPKAAIPASTPGTGWTDNGDDTHTKSITLPAGFTMDTTLIQVRQSSSGDMIYPTIEKTSTTTFDVTNNAAEALIFLYSK